jgi:hypothetical protein
MSACFLQLKENLKISKMKCFLKVSITRSEGEKNKNSWILTFSFKHATKNIER